MNPPSQDELVTAIANATRLAVVSLFRERAERFYYICLTTSGGATAPGFSAWSIEALERAIEGQPEPEKARSWTKWSYADSPYWLWGEEHFETVRQLFLARPHIYDLAPDERAAEYDLRLDAMEMALRRLDDEGLFGTGASRSDVVVLAEVMPPDYTNTQRAHRLNPPSALVSWLAEAAEPEPTETEIVYVFFTVRSSSSVGTAKELAAARALFPTLGDMSVQTVREALRTGVRVGPFDVDTAASLRTKAEAAGLLLQEDRQTISLV